MSSAVELYAGASGTAARIIDWDDYVAEINTSLIEKYQLLLATPAAGNQLTIKSQGPFFVAFPFSQHEALRKDLHYSQSLWQVKSIEIF